MKPLFAVFRVVHAVIALLFAIAALMLIALAARDGWTAFFGEWDEEVSQSIIEAVGLLAAAVVALQIAETVAEEEVIREADISGPTRVRRFLSRFFVVIIVSLAVEGLVATFRSIHEDMTQLVYAASLLVGTAALLAAWGFFVQRNRAAEELEPDAMEEAKREDRKLQ